MLTKDEKIALLHRFPPLDLSYENILYKKVQADIYMLIPSGKKAFIWFSYWKDKNMCFIILLNKDNNFEDVLSYPVCFSSKLSLNTIIYGTLFSNNNMKHFSCEQLFYYKNSNVTDYTFLEKLSILKDMFDHEIKQIAYNNEFLILGLPIMKTNYDQMISCINGLSYTVSLYTLYDLKNKDPTGSYRINKPVLPEAIFNVKPTLEMDIYHLYCNNSINSNNSNNSINSNNSDKKHGLALIPSYRCSVMMNSIFRKIKENVNLDLLEESDDEYENTDVDRFVNLDYTFKMRCSYNKKFKKWQPIEVADNREKLTDYKDVIQLEKCY